MSWMWAAPSVSRRATWTGRWVAEWRASTSASGTSTGLKSERLEGPSGRVSFEVADVHDLPFDADRFDTVFTESVMVLDEDQSQAVAQCLRIASAE